MTNLENSKCNKTQKTQIVKKKTPKNSNCDKTQKL